MLEWLTRILPENINFSPSINVNIKVIKIGSDNGSKGPVVIDGENLLIDDTKLKGEVVDQIIKELPDNLEHNDVVLESNNLDDLSLIDQEMKEGDYEKELAKYKGIVAGKDVPILEVAILIKIKSLKGENIGPMKGQLVQRFGSRAGMICNLYSAGYFESLILPLYQSIEGGTLALDEYLDIYEMIVTESPLAMFIGIGITKAKARQLLLDKISSNRANDVEHINIHGIGDSNIALIKALLSDTEISSQFTEEPTLNLVDKSIKATIYI